MQPCSGKEVDSKISVIVDLSKDSTVNLNQFSYFFSERLKELVKDCNMEISKAWKQAEKEVRTLFALPEGDAALEAFAASALMDCLGERAIAKSAPQWRSELFAANLNYATDSSWCLTSRLKIATSMVACTAWLNDWG